MTRNFQNLPNRTAYRMEGSRRRTRRRGIVITAIIAIAALSWCTGCATARAGRDRAGAASNADFVLTGKTWLLAGYSFEGQFIPLEPGHGSAAKLVFRPDGTLAGFTGTNTFAGAWQMGKTSSAGIRQFTATTAGLSKKASPNEIAARFEADFLRELASAGSIQIKKDSIQLLDGRGGILLRFIAASANGLY